MTSGQPKPCPYCDRLDCDPTNPAGFACEQSKAEYDKLVNRPTPVVKPATQKDYPF